MQSNESGPQTPNYREIAAKLIASAPVLLLAVGLVLVMFGIVDFATRSIVAHRQEVIFDEYLSKVNPVTIDPGFPALRKRIILSLGIYRGKDTAIASGAVGLVCLVIAYYLSRRKDEAVRIV